MEVPPSLPASKWEAVARSADETRYVICNADESEPGTFKDRVIMEEDPFAVIESMTIAGVAIGAQEGYLYIRGEYPVATDRLRRAMSISPRELAARSESDGFRNQLRDRTAERAGGVHLR